MADENVGVSGSVFDYYAGKLEFEIYPEFMFFLISTLKNLRW